MMKDPLAAELTVPHDSSGKSSASPSLNDLKAVTVPPKQFWLLSVG